MKQIAHWIWYSSADATKISATIKNIAVFIPTIVATAALLHVNLDGTEILKALDYVGIAIGSVIATITAVKGAVAAFRKVLTTIKGTNDVINNYEG